MPSSSASSLRIGRQLLAQQELPLLLLHALLDVLADRLGDVQLGQVLAAPGQQLLQPLADVGGLQQLDLLLDRSGRRRSRPGRPAPTGRRSAAPCRRPARRPRCCRIATARALYSLASSRVRGVVRRLSCDRRPRPTAPRRARWCRRRCAPGRCRAPPRARSPPGSRPICSMTPSVPDLAYLPSSRGTSSTCDLAPRVARPCGGLDGRADLGVRQLERHHHAGQHDLVVQREHREGLGRAGHVLTHFAVAPYKK